MWAHLGCVCRLEARTSTQDGAVSLTVVADGHPQCLYFPLDLIDRQTGRRDSPLQLLDIKTSLSPILSGIEQAG